MLLQSKKYYHQPYIYYITKDSFPLLTFERSEKKRSNKNKNNEKNEFAKVIKNTFEESAETIDIPRAIQFWRFQSSAVSK